MIEKQHPNMKSYVCESDEIQNEEIGSESNSDDNSGNNFIEDDPLDRKRYHRHTSRQIEEMEAFFKECPHPDNKQKKELSRKLGMELLQVKFWFQNKRTQMKTQHERHENTQLRIENEKLRAENLRYREALSNASCSCCGGPTSIAHLSIDEHCLRIENARLREEIDCISSMGTKYVDRPLMSSIANDNGTLNLENEAVELGYSTYVTSQNKGEKMVISELATVAMEELMRISQIGEPLWVPSIDLNTTLLNKEEYFRAFPRGFGPKLNGFKSEASRESVVIVLSPAYLVEILLDVNQWSDVFSGVVSRAMNLQVVSSGDGLSYNGAVQVMNAEFHVPSPLVPTRESYFVRHCKHHVDGTWAVVDVSIDQLQSTEQIKCRKRPSGCIVQAMLNGYSKVTWVEHVEVEDRVVHNIYKPLVNAGLAFGAKRWVAILERHCERVASQFTADIPPGNFDYSLLASQEGRTNMLKLADRMMAIFCCGVSASSSNTWSNLSSDGANDAKVVMTRKNVDDSGRLLSIQLSAATSLWLPIPPRRVFDFLRDESTRNQWDTLLDGGDLQAMDHIVIGNEAGNQVSIYQLKDNATSCESRIILQETRTDPTASYIVYAPIDTVSLEVVLGGGDTAYISLLPSGFAILPDGPVGGQGGMRAQTDSGGSLLTIAFQVLVDPSPNSNLSFGSVAAVSKLIVCTVDRIKNALINPRS